MSPLILAIRSTEKSMAVEKERAVARFRVMYWNATGSETNHVDSDGQLL